MIYMLFFRSGLRQKSPSVIPLEIEPTESTIETDAPDDIADESVETSQDLDLAGSEDITEIEIAETEAEIEMDWDPDSEDPELLDDLATDEKSVGVTNKTSVSNELKTAAVESKGEDGLNGEDAPNTEDQASDLDAGTEDEAEEAIAEDSDTDSEDTTELVNQDDNAEDAIAKDGEDADSEDTTEAIAEEDAESEVEEETEPVLTEKISEFNSGVFTVGASGEVAIDLLFDGGKYKGELAIFSLNGMEEFEPGSEEFIREAAGRALSNSTSGYIVFSDQTEGAKFSGELGDKNYNSGDYLGAKTFTMRAGDQFGFMLVANGRVQQVFDNPDIGGALRPLFSMATANPDDAFHVGQIADVTGDGNTFVMEDMRVDTGSDKDYNDIIFQVRGATGNTVNLDDVINPAKDWRDSDLGKEIISGETKEIDPIDIIETPKPDVEYIGKSDPVNIIKVQKPDVVVIVDNPEETNIPNVPFTESEIIKDDWVNSTAYNPGETTPNPNVPPIVDPALIVNPWDIDRSTLFPPNYDPLVDGVGSSVTVTQSSNVTTTVNISSSTSVTTFVNASSNRAPIVPSANVTVGLGESLNRYFFTAYDPDAPNPNSAYYNGDQIQQFLIQDTNTSANSGYFTLNGVKQTGSFYVPASAIYQSSDMNYLKFVAGSEAGVVDPVFVSAYDGQVWSNPGAITINTTAQVNQIPTVTAYNQTLRPGTVLSPDAFFTTSDPNGDTIQRYALYDPDDSITSGYFTLNGEKLQGSANGWYFMASTQLASLRFVAGSRDSVDTFRINAIDGRDSGSRSIQITTSTSTTNVAPVVTTTNKTVDIGTTISPNFFTVSDANSDTIQKYYFSDNNNSSTSGYFTLNGVRQQDILEGIWRNNSFFVDASQLANVRFVAGSQAGTDSVTIQAYDGKSWSSYANVNLTTQAANRVPVLTDSKRTLDPGTSVAASSLFTITDADGDVIQKYNFYDDTTRSTSGYFTLNGVRQNGSFSVDASQLANVRFVAGSEAGIDWLSIDAYDGKGWSDAPTITVTTKQPNRAPVVTTTNKTLDVGTRLFAFDFFTVTDADGDTPQQYYFYDANPSSTSGYFTFNGVKQDAGFYATPSQLANVRFVAGSQAGADTVYVQASDGKAWSNYPSVTLTTQQPNRVPVVTPYNTTLDTGTSIAASNFFTVSDADGDTIQQYYFTDYTSSSTSGYLTLNGVRQDAGFSVTASQLANVRFVAGSQAGTDDIVISAYDGKAWNSLGFGAGVAKLITKQANRAPLPIPINRTINTGAVINADFFTVSDPDGDAIQQYYFLDNNTSTTSGYFTLNGVKQTAGFYVAANQLASVKFVGGSLASSDSVTVYASDGKTWGVNNATITTQQVNRAPIVTTYNRNLNVGTTTNADFFTVSDPDGDVIQQYYFYDQNSNGTSGYFTLNGVRQAAGFSVAASQLASVKFVAGSQVGTDAVTVYAYDGKTWGSSDVALNTQQPNRPPVVTTSNQTVKRGNSISPNFTVADADGDAITQYAFYDSNATSTSGYFTINGVKQAAGTIFYVNPNELSTVKFVGGTTGGTDGLYVWATDGKNWSDASNYTATTIGGSAPTVTLSNATVNANATTSLSFNISDADNDPVTRYEFSDGNGTATSGYFTVNGVKQAAGSTFSVDASQISTVKFVGGAAGGIDQVAVRVTDGLDGWSGWSYANMTTQAVVTNDWFDLNIKDTTIRSLARSKFQDGIFSREDMIAIFDSAKDGAVVDANEFGDLRLLASDVTYIKMADASVRNLSQKIALGDTNAGWTNQNAKYLGQALGNLYAGSSADQLQKLINEHFYGLDLPSATGIYAYGSAVETTYKPAQGKLFQGGIQYTDVRQGVLGDCYYLAALAGLAIKDASKIQDMFIDNGDGTYTVRFFNNGKADYVTVDRQLPVVVLPDSSEYLPFARVGASIRSSTDVNNELWVALAEKAYAQVNEAGWLNRGNNQDGINSYIAIEAGGAELAATNIAQVKGTYHGLNSSNITEAIAAFASGSAVFISSIKAQHGASIGTERIAAPHAYVLTSYDTNKKTVTLFNPWNSGNDFDNDGYITVAWSDIPTYFYAWREAS